MQASMTMPLLLSPTTLIFFLKTIKINISLTYIVFSPQPKIIEAKDALHFFKRQSKKKNILPVSPTCPPPEKIIKSEEATKKKIVKDSFTTPDYFKFVVTPSPNQKQ